MFNPSPNLLPKDDAIDGASDEVRLPGGDTATIGGVTEGGGAGVGVGGAGAVILAALALKKLPIPDPQDPIVARAAKAVSVSFVGDIGVGIDPWLGAGGFVGVRLRPTPSDSGLRPPPLTGWGGASEKAGALPLLSIVEDAVVELGNAGGVDGFGDVPGLEAAAAAALAAAAARCAAIRWETSLRTPSKALNIDVEPALKADERASRVDSMFLSSLSS